MLQLTPYLSFSGNCREAMTFYQECLGGELALQTMAETPVAAEIPADAQHHIVHATLTNGRVALMASDAAGMREPVSEGSNSVALSLNCVSDEQITTLFDKLSAGGTVIDPLAIGFWGGKFGCVADRFGKRWLLHFEAAPAL